MLSITFPAISPILFEFGPISIRWYSLAYIFGFIFAWKYIQYLIKQKGFFLVDHNISPKDVDDLIFYGIIGLIFGARFGYILFYNFSYYISEPIRMFYVWEGGLSFHGGLLGIVLAIFLFTKSKKISFLTISDLICASAPVGIFLGRISNFINAELYGRPTDVFIGIIFPNTDGLHRHPSQIYEALLEGLTIFIVLNIMIYNYKKLKQTGYISGMFLMLYSIFRFLIEFTREPDIQVGYIFNQLTMGMILSIPMFLFGIVLIYYSKKNDGRK